MKSWVVLFLVACSFGMVSAEPLIDGVSGTFEHGESFSISGSGFGGKSPAAPLMWQDAEDEIVDDWNEVKNDFVQARPVPEEDFSPEDDYAMQYRSSWAGMSHAHSRSSKYIAGGHCPNTDSGVDECHSVELDIYSGSLRQDSYFIMYYLRLHDDWADSYGRGANYKELWFNDGTHQDGGDVYNFNFVIPDEESLFRGDEYVVGITGNDGLRFFDGGGYQTTIANPRVRWVHRVLMIDRDSGYVYWGSDDDGSEWIGAQEYADELLLGDMSTFSIGSYARSQNNGTDCPGGIDQTCTHAGMKRYFDDIYVDTTFSRVVLTDNSDYSLSGVIEPQIPSVWDDGSISVTMNLGGLSGESVYLFVFDADNNHNEVGYEVVVGGEVALLDCVDGDGDGYGVGVDCLGLDCDDNDGLVWSEVNCSFNGTACSPRDDSGEPGYFSVCGSCVVVPEEICGNGVDEDCDGVDLVCVCAHDADLEPCDGVVSVGELRGYIDLWLGGGVSMGEVVGAIGAWAG